MNHEEWLEQAEIYALGALDGEELIQFEAHLASGCPTCENHLRETREALTLLARSLTPLAPSPAVKARLLEQITSETARPTLVKPRSWRLWWRVGASALAAASLLIVWSAQLSRTRQDLQRVQGVVATLQADLEQREESLRALNSELLTTRQELQRLEGTVAALQAELAHRQETFRVELVQREEALQLLSDPEVRLVRLAGLPPSPAATGRLLWNPVTRVGVFLTTGLPLAPQDKAYELWAIAGAEPVPAGVFTVDEKGRAILWLPPLPKAKRFNKFAVTLEPAGGVQKPMGPMHLLGSL